MREETLGDRIGERMRSRLQEMCVVVEMQRRGLPPEDKARILWVRAHGRC